MNVSLLNYLPYCRADYKVGDEFKTELHNQPNNSDRVNSVGRVAFDQLPNKEEFLSRKMWTMKEAQNFRASAQVFFKENKFDEALEFCQKSLAIREKHQSDTTAADYNHIAIILMHQFKLNEALNLVKTRAPILENQDPDSLSMANLCHIGGQIYQCQGRLYKSEGDKSKNEKILNEAQAKLEKALKLFQKSIAIREAIKPDSDELTLSRSCIEQIECELKTIS